MIENGSSNDVSSINGISPIPGIVAGAVVGGHQQTTPQPPTSQQVSPQSQQSSTMSSQILGSTPLGQIGCPPLSLDQYSGIS